MAEALSAIRHRTLPRSRSTSSSHSTTTGGCGLGLGGLADQDGPVGYARRGRRPRIRFTFIPDWDLHAVVRQMSDYNLTVAPVMDEEHRKMLGVVTVDDVLETLLPSGWRKTPE